MTAVVSSAKKSVSAASVQDRRSGRLAVTVSILLVVLVAGMLVSGFVGELSAGFTDVLGTALAKIGIHTSWQPKSEIIQEALWNIRFPRVLTSLVVGAALAVGGAVMQAIFGNPLAEPGVVGVSAGGALGAAIAIAFSVGGTWSPALFAFVGALAATFLAYSTARSGGRIEMITLLLTGIAVNAVAAAGLAFVVFSADTAAREQIIFWQLGSLNGTRWNEFFIVAVVVTVGSLAALAVARQYDVLALGERSAAHLGVRVERLRIGSIVLVALLTGAAVAFVGIIGFVGLVVPHVVRMILGPAHRSLILVSMLGGAVLTVWADMAARTLVHGADLPIGMLTALVGGPFFFWLVRRTRHDAGGWA